MDFTIYPMLQYPRTHFSNIPVFHYFNLGEVPDLVQILDFFKCNLSIIFNQFFIESLLRLMFWRQMDKIKGPSTKWAGMADDFDSICELRVMSYGQEEHSA